MPQQQLQYDDGAALATAQWWIARGREPADDSFPLIKGFAPLDPEAGGAMVRYVLKQHARVSLLRMTEVCQYARAGWREADLALRELITEYYERGERAPTPLAAYEMELLDPHRLPPRWAKGKKKSSHLMRDLVIAVAVGDVIGQHGLKPTRWYHKQSRQPSACSVVAHALEAVGMGMGEKAVEKIWERWQCHIGDYRRTATHTKIHRS